MAFADTLRSATVSWSDAATLMENLLITASVDFDSDVISTSSTSYQVMTGNSLSVTVVAGEKVLLLATGNCSHGTAAGFVFFGLHRDTTQVGIDKNISVPYSGTGGDSNEWTVIGLDNPGAGTYTYTCKYKVSAGTGYVRNRTLIALRIRGS